MALPTSNISINDIHLVVGGGSGTQASLNDTDIRTWGNSFNVHAANPSYNVGTAGISTSSGSEIAIGEFRGGVVPPANTAFQGTFTHRYSYASGGQYAPSTNTDTTSSFSNSTFTGTLMGVSATHTVNTFSNGGIAGTRGIVTLAISNNASATYSNTGWTSVTFGSQNGSSYTLLRTDATFSASGSSGTYQWGSAGQSFNYANGYLYTTHFGGVNSYSSALGAYNNITGSFQVTL
mgnify:CR=1 FL=1